MSTAAIVSNPRAGRSIQLAQSIVLDQFYTLKPAARSDYVRLYQSLLVIDDELVMKLIERTMSEILEQIPVEAFPLELPSEPDGELKAWAGYVGHELRRRRTEAKLTQTQLAELTGIPQSHLSRLENAQHSANVYTLEKIAKALNIDVNELMPPEYRAK